MEINVTLDFFLPEEYKDFFYAEKLEDKGKYYVLTVIEKEEKIPEELKGKKVVLNGFKEKISLVDYPTKAKLIYLDFYRRRWKEKGKRESFSNTYNLTPKGCKITNGFGIFLKGLTGHERSELFATVKGLEVIWRQNSHLV